MRPRKPAALSIPDGLWDHPAARDALARRDIAVVSRHFRQHTGLSQTALGSLTGLSQSDVSDIERGVRLVQTAGVLARIAEGLHIPPHLLGLAAATPARAGATPARPQPLTVTGEAGHGGDDDVQRRRLLANLVVTAAAAAGAPVPRSPAPAGDATTAELLTGGVRDAMLGLQPAAAAIPAARLHARLEAALADFRHCRYGRLAATLPQLISSGHVTAADTPEDPAAAALLASIYTLATRMLIKLDDQQLGWMAADRARVVATAADDPLTAAEAARNLAILARKAGWHDQAMSLALTAADHPALAGSNPEHTAERGLLLQSAAYTAARSGDRAGMRELTADAARIAASLTGTPLLRDHGGGFSPATVTLHQISAEHSIGEAGAAIEAARRIRAASLPTIERQSRYFTDVARAYGQAGHRDKCLHALLAAERRAPEEIHARPAIRELITGLLLSGRSSPELRGLAARCRIT